MPLRSATPEDIPAMVALERQSSSASHWPELTYSRLFEQGSPRRIALVIFDEGSEGGGDSNRTLSGFLVALVSADECELENIVVAPRNQSSGLGTKLVYALVAAVRAQGVTRIFLEVRESNLRARSLYEKCGFAITGRRKSYYKDPEEDAVLYALQL